MSRRLTEDEEGSIERASNRVTWFVLGALMAQWWPTVTFGISSAFCIWLAICWFGVIADRSSQPNGPLNHDDD